MSEFVSECCGATMTGLMIDHGICPDCKEHCEVIDLKEEGIDIPKEIREWTKGRSKLTAEIIEHAYRKGFVDGETEGVEWGKKLADKLLKEVKK